MSSPNAHEWNHEWHTPQRASTKGLHNVAAVPYRVIEEVTGVPKSTAWDHAHAPESRRPESNRHRPMIFSQEDVRKMIKKATKDWATRKFGWIELARAYGFQQGTKRTI